MESFETLSTWLKAPEYEGWNEDGHSRLIEQLLARLPSEQDRQLTDVELREADVRIVGHWKHITKKRNLAVGQTLYPLYFQWFALLLTEVYLERYFRNQKTLVSDLNGRVEKWNEKAAKAHQINEFTLADLNKLAFWMATGSGKTLLMHCQIRQFLYHLGKAGKRSNLNRIILLTPNEGLSEQHLKELQDSDMEAALFDKDGSDTLFTGYGIDIIDIHKLSDTSKEKTVAVDSFEGNNLVLVDEGNRGSGGDGWMERRAKLCESGFSFEYSATFGQAIRAATGAKKKKLEQTYARCIAFDYSYKYFYTDGYGKDFHILNLKEEQEEETRPLYLTACLLAFFQQCLRYRRGPNQLKPYGLADPLLIFVGRSVLASGSNLTVDGKKTASDMIEVLRFLGLFIGDKKETVRRLQLLLQRKSDLVAGGKRIFDDFYPFISSEYSPDKTGAEKLFGDILTTLFQAPAGGGLHVVHLTGSDGEIGLRVGATNEFFGVVNVGESKKLCDLLEEEKEDLDRITIDQQPFSHSLFNDINKPDSSIRLLMGSKKFTEGWSSWRVSTMGFMNIGKKEGSEIIQLFGRGVRLKGYNFTLKRSRELDSLFYRDDEGQTLSHPEHIELLEILNIFGVRSDYMKEFEEYLEEEGLGEDERPETIILPTIANLARKDLKIIRKKEDSPEFKRENKLWLTSLETELNTKVVADWYPRLESQQTRRSNGSSGIALPNEATLAEKHLAFVNWDEVYFELEAFKRQKALYNILFTPDILKDLAKESWWYVLLIPENQMEFQSFAKTRLWQEIVTSLLKGYLEKFYYHHKRNHDAPYMEVQTLKESDPNFVTEYRAKVKRSEVTLIRELERIRDELTAKKKAVLDFAQIDIFGFDKHLYHPLISLRRPDRGVEPVIKISPVHLNDGEKAFVMDMKRFCESSDAREFLKEHELYLLRNQSKGKGIGFFEDAGFYPDFLLWIISDDGHQRVTFLDPKGLGRISDQFRNPKIRFHETLQTLHKTQLKDDKLTLNSFIISNTHQHELRWSKPDGSDSAATLADYHKHHILFQKDDPDHYIKTLVEMIS